MPVYDYKCGNCGCSDYTPTTEEVRADYIYANPDGRDYYDEPFDAGPQFDRWLTKVKAEAWYEGYEARGRMERINNEDTHDGPYR